MAIVGKPGSGKTTVIQKLLETDLASKFNYIMVISPSCVEYKDYVYEDQCFPDFTQQNIVRIINFLNCVQRSCKKPLKILLILDDVIADIKALEKNSTVVGLFFNRRHLVENSCISIMLTTQKYTMIPARFRSCMTDIRFFTLSQMDIEKIFIESVIKY